MLSEEVQIHAHHPLGLNAGSASASAIDSGVLHSGGKSMRCGASTKSLIMSVKADAQQASVPTAIILDLYAIRTALQHRDRLF